MSAHKKLPAPSLDAKEHSAKLTQMIKTASPMLFSQFMEQALYTPNYGYYTNNLSKIGASGDFITAPEISPIFSRCLARQTAQALNELSQKNIIEFGAGRGIMARDILVELDANGIEFDSYQIIEISHSLQQVQQSTLQALPEALLAKVTWLSALPKQPIEAVILANEVIDAMPIERLRFDHERAYLSYVAYQEDTQTFNWQYQPLANISHQLPLDKSKPLNAFAEKLISTIGLPSDETHATYDTEINLNISPWIQSISDFLSKGLILLVDYGYSRQEYYQPARSMGTLRCHYQQLAHSDPFFYPGLQDLTAHVDFTAIAEAAMDADLDVAGYTTQAHFLMGSGLLEMAAPENAETTEQIKIAQQIKTLTLPDEMGETFKVIALTKDLDTPLIGFAMRDLRHHL